MDRPAAPSQRVLLSDAAMGRLAQPGRWTSAIVVHHSAATRFGAR